MPRWLVILAVSVVVLSGALLLGRAVGFFVPGRGSTTPEGGNPPMDFAVRDLDDQEVHLHDLRGHVVLANFWATWCGPCRAEMTTLQQVYERHREDGFIVVGINVSNRPEEASAFAQEHGLTFPIWRDPLGDVLLEAGIQGLPASFLFDAEGHLTKRWVGPLTEEELETALEPLLP